MAVEVYTSTRPASPRRALFASLLLLAAACAAAWVTSTSRSGGMLAPKIKPPGWTISFRCPARFRKGEFIVTPFGSAYRFFALTREGVPAVLAVHRLEAAEGTDPREVCDRVLRAHLDPRVLSLGTAPLIWTDKRLGSYRAVELWDPLIGTIVVRAAVVSGGDAYAVSLWVDGEIRPDLYRLFDKTCASFEHRIP